MVPLSKSSVKTKDWRTPVFEIKRKVTLCLPVIFLTVFNPLIELSSCLTTSTLSLKVPVLNSVGPSPNKLCHLCTLR